MNVSKYWILGGLLISFFQTSELADAHERKARHSDTEIVWESDRLFTTWFGNVHQFPLGPDGALAEWVVVKAGDRWDLKVDQITVRYLDPHHDRPVRKSFYPYERIQRGNQVRFKLPELRRIVGIRVVTSGWSGSHLRDGFRVFLKKDTHRPLVETIRTGYFYGQCIGGRRCPGYRRTHLQRFSIDLEDVRNIKNIQFYSHDNVGSSHNAKVSVYVDDEKVAHRLNIKSAGSKHRIELRKVFGRYITFEATQHDEAVIQRITVDYNNYQSKSRRKNHPRNHPRRHEDLERHKQDRSGGQQGNHRFPRGPHN